MEDWKSKYRNSMEGHRSLVPERLWEGVSAGLAQRRRHRTAWISSLSAAAAIALAAILAWPEPAAPSEAPLAKVITVETPEDMRTPETEEMPAIGDPAVGPVHIPESKTSLLARDVQKPEEETTPSEFIPKTEDPAPTRRPSPIADEAGKCQDESGPAEPFAGPATPKKRPIRLAVSVQGTSGHYSSDNFAPVRGLLMADYANGVIKEKRVENNTNHSIPVKLMVTAGIPLAKRLTLETGISYGYLHSVVSYSIGSGSYGNDQRLNYIGIPLGLRLSLLQNAGIGWYLGAGGLAEKMVYGTTRPMEGSESIRVKMNGLQYSVYAVTGIEARLMPHVGLAFEPGVSYYFPATDIGIKTIYQERPLNFELRFALHFSF